MFVLHLVVGLWLECDCLLLVLRVGYLLIVLFISFTFTWFVILFRFVSFKI